VVMATLAQPKILLLDEHVAALDPRAARQVMALTEDIVRRQRLSTLMVTHNMEQSIRFGDRLIMLHSGKALFDVAGPAKRSLTVPDLLRRFAIASGEAFTDDEALLVTRAD
ncbi:MAG: ATP-binding cassette domain-containing protein, partial [Chloroflexota bacterium]